MRLSEGEERERALVLSNRLDTRHLDVNREPIIYNAIQARHQLLMALREFFRKKGIVEHAVPHLVAKTGACESHDRIFALDYYGQEAFLVQSCQLHQECFLPKFGTVYSVNESFRKEHFFSHNHLSESTLFESLSKGNTLEKELEFVEEMLSSVSNALIKSGESCFEYFGLENLETLTQRFGQISYAEALEICDKSGGDFTSEEDEKITREVGKPVFLTHHPASIKFFSTKRDGDRALSADLLLSLSGETMGITQTENNPETLERQFMESPLAPARAQYEWYFELHREYDFFQSGFGMGVERLLKFVCGLPSITLAVPFVRYNHHLNP